MKSAIEEEILVLESEIPTIVSKLRNSEHIFQIQPQTRTVQNIVRFSSEHGIYLLFLLESIQKVISLICENETEIQSQLAGPKMTAKVIRTLPLLGFFIGFLFGVNPVNSLFFTNSGRAALFVGLIFWGIGIYSTNKLIAKNKAITNQNESVWDHSATQIALLSALISSGKSLHESICIVCDLKNRSETVWFKMKIKKCFWFLKEPYLLGLSPIPVIKNEIEKMLREELLEIKTASEKLGIKLLLPISLAYLPSFICIGVFPIIESLIQTM